MKHNPDTTTTGPRWVPIDEWLKRYDDSRDPSGQYGTPGRNPATINPDTTPKAGDAS